MHEKMIWPDGKKFAFTVFDDTDGATLENVAPVYGLLNDLGIKTTKSVWPIAGSDEPVLGGDTCEDDDYRRWLLELKQQGFEIGLHNATYHTSRREDTLRAIQRFERIFGHAPMSLANHTSNSEGLYWGPGRLSGINAAAYVLLTRFRRIGRFRGHEPGNPLFWGDVCQERIKYVRNFVFADINTLAACPQMPYHDPRRPYVNYWFASTEGDSVRSFTKTLAEANVDRLEREGGACIMYTHFSEGFCRNGRLDERFEERMRSIAKRDGWFVPVTRLLDYILQKRGSHQLSGRERASLERRWLLHKVMVGTT